jgi:hypothetical protein
VFIVGNYRFEAFIPQERRLAQASSRRVQMMRRDFRREVTESNAKNMSHVRHLLRGFKWQQRADPLRQSSLWKRLKRKSLDNPCGQRIKNDNASVDFRNRNVQWTLSCQSGILNRRNEVSLLSGDGRIRTRVVRFERRMIPCAVGADQR